MSATATSLSSFVAPTDVLPSDHPTARPFDSTPHSLRSGTSQGRPLDQPATRPPDPLTTLATGQATTPIALPTTVQTSTSRPNPGSPTASATYSAPATPGRETPTPSVTPTPIATLTPSATPTPSATTKGLPLAIRKDRGCLDTTTNTLYIFGEVVNSSAQAYDVDDIDPAIFGPAGAILTFSESFDMPGDFFVRPNGAMPFQITAELERPGFTHYALTILANPGRHSPRDDLVLGPIVTTPDNGDLLVEVTWTNPSPVSAYVSPFVAAYDAQGRMTNLAYEFLTGSDTDTGAHMVEMMLFANPCWSAGDTLAPGIAGE